MLSILGGEEQLRGNWKPTNPKDVVGIKKAAFSCVSMPVMLEVGVGMQEGAMKYGRHNYRDEGVAASTYFDATMRHLMDWWEGENLDPDSGLSHITKAIASLMVLRDAQINDLCTDDRPIRPLNPNWLKELNEKAARLVEKYPEPKAPFTHEPLERKYHHEQVYEHSES